MKHLKSSNTESPAARYLLALLLCAGFLVMAVSSTSPALAQTSGSALPPEAQKAYERGYAAAEQGEWGLAVKYFSEAQKAAWKSPEVLFNLAFACSNAGGRDILAIAWYRAYLAAAPDAPNAAEVRKEIINLEVKAEANVSELLRRAKDAAGEIPNSYGKSTAYKNIAVSQTYVGDIAGAHKNLALAKKVAESIEDDDYESDAYSTIVAVQILTGDISGARATAEGMEGLYSQGTAYLFVAKAQARKGDIVGARATAENIEDGYTKSMAYGDIAELQAETGDIAGARESLALAKKAAARESLTSAEKAAGITDDYQKSEASRHIANARAKVDKAAGDRKSTAQAKETTPAKEKYEASAEIKSWTGLVAWSYRSEPALTDLQGFLKSLKEGDMDIDYVLRDLTEAYKSMAHALKELQDNEVKWQELRARSTQ